MSPRTRNAQNGNKHDNNSTWLGPDGSLYMTTRSASSQGRRASTGSGSVNDHNAANGVASSTNERPAKVLRRSKSQDDVHAAINEHIKTENGTVDVSVDDNSQGAAPAEDADLAEESEMQSVASYDLRSAAGLADDDEPDNGPDDAEEPPEHELLRRLRDGDGDESDSGRSTPWGTQSPAPVVLKLAGRRFKRAKRQAAAAAAVAATKDGTVNGKASQDVDEPGGILKRLPGRRRAPHPDLDVEVDLRRQLELKVAYRAVAKALKPVLTELADRTLRELQDERAVFKEYEQYKIVMDELDSSLNRRLTIGAAQLREEEQRYKREYQANQELLRERCQDVVQDRLEDSIVGCQRRILAALDTARGHEDSDATDIEDGVVPSLYHIDMKARKRTRIPQGYDSRSRWAMETERQWAELERRLDFRAQQQQFDVHSLVPKPRGFAVADGATRDRSIAVLNLLRLREAGSVAELDARSAAATAAAAAAVTVEQYRKHLTDPDNVKALETLAVAASSGGVAKLKVEPGVEREPPVLPKGPPAAQQEIQRPAPAPSIAPALHPAVPTVQTAPANPRQHNPLVHFLDGPAIWKVGSPAAEQTESLEANADQSLDPLDRKLSVTVPPPANSTGIASQLAQSSQTLQLQNSDQKGADIAETPTTAQHDRIDPLTSPKSRPDRTRSPEAAGSQSKATPAPTPVPALPPTPLQFPNISGVPAQAHRPSLGDIPRVDSTKSSSEWPGFSPHTATHPGRTGSFDGKIGQPSPFPPTATPSFSPPGATGGGASTLGSPGRARATPDAQQRFSGQPSFYQGSPAGGPSFSPQSPFVSQYQPQPHTPAQPPNLREIMPFPGSRADSHGPLGISAHTNTPGGADARMPPAYTPSSLRSSSGPGPGSGTSPAFADRHRSRSGPSPPGASGQFQAPAIAPARGSGVGAGTGPGAGSGTTGSASRSQMEQHPGQAGHQRILPANLDPNRTGTGTPTGPGSSSGSGYVGHGGHASHTGVEYDFRAYSGAQSSGHASGQPLLAPRPTPGPAPGAGHSPGPGFLGRTVSNSTSVASGPPARNRGGRSGSPRSDTGLGPRDDQKPFKNGPHSPAVSKGPGQLQWKHYANIQPAPTGQPLGSHYPTALPGLTNTPSPAHHHHQGPPLPSSSSQNLVDGAAKAPPIIRQPSAGFRRIVDVGKSGGSAPASPGGPQAASAGATPSMHTPSQASGRPLPLATINASSGPLLPAISTSVSRGSVSGGSAEHDRHAQAARQPQPQPQLVGGERRPSQSIQQPFQPLDTLGLASGPREQSPLTSRTPVAPHGFARAPASNIIDASGGPPGAGVDSMSGPPLDTSTAAAQTSTGADGRMRDGPPDRPDRSREQRWRATMMPWPF